MRIAHCALCAAAAPVRVVARDFNQETSREDFEYRECAACHLIFLANVPPDLAQHYPAEYVTPPASLAALQRVARRTRHQMDLVASYVSGGALLEIGPGGGSFSWLARNAGFRVTAIEADASACEHLRRVVGVGVIRSRAPQDVLAVIEEQYDVIAMWHVLEHLPNPWDTLRQAARVLRPGGVLVVATPNPGAWQFRQLGRYWPHLDAPRHLWLVPLDVLRDYLRPLGLTVAEATTVDRDGLAWNRFGWSQAALNLQPRRLRRTLPVRVATRAIGSAIAAVVRSWERADMRGSAYTALFRKQG